jgi:hypothetical protein
MPATTALGPKDLTDGVGRGAVRHVISNADQVDKFADITGISTASRLATLHVHGDYTGWPT